MKISLTDQHKRLVHCLPLCKPLPLSYNDPTILREQETQLLVPTRTPVHDLSRCNVTFLFEYQIFPPPILVFAAEWQVQQRTLQVGDVIVQQVFLPPLSLSIKCIFAVRILEVTRQPAQIGFSYGTLQGHVERGISEFSLRLRHDSVYATIHTYSAPGLFISRAVAPIFIRPYQRYCTKRALERMRSTFLAANPGLAQG